MTKRARPDRAGHERTLLAQVLDYQRAISAIDILRELTDGVTGE